MPRLTSVTRQARSPELGQPVGTGYPGSTAWLARCIPVPCGPPFIWFEPRYPAGLIGARQTSPPGRSRGGRHGPSPVAPGVRRHRGGAHRRPHTRDFGPPRRCLISSIASIA